MSRIAELWNSPISIINEMDTNSNIDVDGEVVSFTIFGPFSIECGTELWTIKWRQNIIEIWRKYRTVLR